MDSLEGRGAQSPSGARLEVIEGGAGDEEFVGRNDDDENDYDEEGDLGDNDDD